MGSVKVIQIGIGGFGFSWLEIINNFEGIDLLGVVDLDPQNIEKAKSIITDSNVKFFHSHLEAFEELEADIAIIITPPQTHKTLALDALKANLHVFMEKPITQDFHEAVDLLYQSRHFEKFIMISQNYRWRPEIQAIKQCIENGEIGAVEYGEWNFRRATKFGGWRDEYKEILIEDMSIHHFDMLRHILGRDATSIYAQSMRPSWSWFGGNPVASASITFDDRILINYFGSWVTRGKETSWNGEVRLVGEKGIIELIDDVPILTTINGTNKQLQLPNLAYTDREYSINEMVEAIRENRRPITSIEDNIKSFLMVGGALESINQGTVVDLRHLLKSAF
ncbi:Gfo/Idh/MocA family protein [Aquibacillus salsiterrae]|uniref:Gfo/Idh/MocA family oxidoreductase n=1 Tax=Aquibacillus salsiterrae TaxID=2950439 RepID=A0A9X3WEL1_9BACI|nr:Gfo/Idh/MocA family oxidoreductase [Aquibacillus salsiterrae]MDC3416014.1 Gfo/Idh/MocA family oxidoreductase [Aquibacillus salsiterrae]